MVMGSGRLLFNSAASKVASLRLSTVLYIFVVILLVNGAFGRRSSSVCRVNDCVSSYNKATRRLEQARERAPEEVEAHTRSYCRALKRQHRCLVKMRRVCRGDLLFHSMEHMNMVNLQNANCSPTPPPSLSPPPPTPRTPAKNSTVPGPTTTAFPGEVTEGGACVYTGKPSYRHCGMFGDPHLRTFTDQFYTCNVEKTWPLIDNDYMVVMVTNVPVQEGSSATVSTKITVVIKAAGECAGQKHYVATSSRLPSGFTDGSVVTGTGGSVSVVEVVPGKHVEIRARFIATTVIIRQVGNYLTFAIRMPQEFVSGIGSKRQLCVQGCPPGQQISPEKKAGKGKRPRGPAAAEFPQEENRYVLPQENSLLGSGNAGLRNDPGAGKRFYTEEEARLKCKQIMLAATGTAREVLRDQEEDREENSVPTGSEEPEQDSSSSSNRFSNSLSSAAFSSLMPSPSDERRGRRKNRMAAASRPDHSLSQSSFRQLLGSQADEPADDAILREQSRTRRRRNRQKRKRKSKRDADRTSGVSKPGNGNVSPDFNFYFDSCVFDLKMTGDVNFTLTAKVALEDIRRTHALRGDAPGASLEVVKLWEPLEPNSGSSSSDGIGDSGENGGKGGAGKPAPTLLVILCLVLSCVYVNFAPLLFCSSSSNTVASDSKRHRRINDTEIYNLVQRTRTFNEMPVRS